MNVKHVESEDYLEVIFDNRNKAYGAYNLRRWYADRMNIAMFISSSAFVLIFLIPLLLYESPYKGLMEINCGSCGGEIIYTEKPFEYPPLDSRRETVRRTTSSENNNRRSIPIVVREDNDTDIDTTIDENPVTTDHTDVSGNNTTGSSGTGTDTGNNNGDNNNGSGTDVPDLVDELGAEVKPFFKGGAGAYVWYMENNLVYPHIAERNGIEGVVYLSAIVGKDGSIREVKILKDIGGGCGLSAKRTVERMPKWIPGMHSGQPVAVKITMRVKFTLH